MGVQANQWENQYGTDPLAVLVDSYAEMAEALKAQTADQKIRRGQILAAFKENGISRYATRLHVATLRPVQGVRDNAVSILASKLPQDVLDRVTERSTTVELLKAAVKRGIITPEVMEEVIDLQKSERLDVE